MRPFFATRRSRILARVALYGGTVFIGLPVAASQVLLGTIRQPTVGPRPPWTEVAVRSEGLRLRAWLAPGDGSRTAAVFVHGLGDSLESYADSGFRLHQRGHTVLLLDLRGHGGSEGRHTTMGGREREDVRAALGALRGRGLGREGFVLLGASMGAVAVLRAAAAEADVRAVVAEAPYDDYRSTMARHARLYYGLPSWFPLLPAGIAVAEWRAGFDADEVSAVEAARHGRGALLAIVDGADPRMPEAVVRRVYDAHPGPKRMWTAPGAPHCGAANAPGYWETVLGFLEANGL
ncbi:MAG TPA: alpha/beta fold hydrolase [Vicinamibacteria bacterium]|nr:alpha/beta fold hydrolase [Vicinamibacteria bacterium]